MKTLKQLLKENMAGAVSAAVPTNNMGSGNVADPKTKQLFDKKKPVRRKRLKKADK